MDTYSNSMVEKKISFELYGRENGYIFELYGRE
jgi:hypothetical protein